MNGPDFLCIGAPKCGTTWLHQLLMTHPDVFLPGEIKEIHYFDRFLDRGAGWYSRLFAGATENQISGDVTPHYLYIPDPAVIQAIPSIQKFILLHRDPVDRCVSHFHFRKRLDNYRKSFDEFLIEYPSATNMGMYGKNLERYLQHFSSDQFLILEFESIFKNLAETRSTLSRFLGIDPEKFPEGAGTEKVNSGFVPQNPGLYRIATRVSKWMADRGMYGVRNRLKALVGKRLQKSDNDAVAATVSEESLQRLREQFAPDQVLFQRLITDIKSAHSSNPAKSECQ